MQLDNNIINFIKTHPGDDGAKAFYIKTIEPAVKNAAWNYKHRNSHLELEELRQQIEVISLEVLNSHKHKTQFRLGGFYSFLRLIINQQMTRYLCANLRPIKVSRYKPWLLNITDTTIENFSGREVSNYQKNLRVFFKNNRDYYEGIRRNHSKRGPKP